MEEHSQQPMCPSVSTDATDTDDGMEITHKIMDHAFWLPETASLPPENPYATTLCTI